MKFSTGVRRTLLTGTAMLVTGIAACGGLGTGGMDHGATASGGAPVSAGFNDADVRFAQMMIPHHQQAVVMATLAETRAVDPELRSVAAKIKAGQDPEITTMIGWLAAWGRPTMAPGEHNMPGMGSQMPGMMSDAEMAALGKASGADFDRLFARMMIAHHNGAVLMARDEQADGKSPDAKQLATMIEQAQVAEVATLQKILDRL